MPESVESRFQQPSGGAVKQKRAQQQRGGVSGADVRAAEAEAVPDPRRPERQDKQQIRARGVPGAQGTQKAVQRARRHAKAERPEEAQRRLLWGGHPNRRRSTPPPWRGSS